MGNTGEGEREIQVSGYGVNKSGGIVSGIVRALGGVLSTA